MRQLQGYCLLLSGVSKGALEGAQEGMHYCRPKEVKEIGNTLKAEGGPVDMY